jgi:putative hemolysin
MIIQTAEPLSFPSHSLGKKNIYFSDSKYILKLADNSFEIDEALKLRFDIFNLELNEGLDSSFYTMRDEDKFDSQCNHLIVIDKVWGKIVGTYRLQTYEMSKRGDGFYSETEFYISKLGRSMLKQSVELRRACISREHRNSRVLLLLWKGIWQYLNIHQKRFLFGCCSLSSQDPTEGIGLFRHLERNGYVHTRIRIVPKPDYIFVYAQLNRDANTTYSLPPLMNMYCRYGARVCSLPAIDRSFKTIDYLMMLDTLTLNEENRKMLNT